MIVQAPDRPWEPERTHTCLRGRLLLKVKPGEGPEVPHYLDANGVAPLRFDGGPVDATVRRFSPAMRVTRAFESARSVTGQDTRRGRWDEVEEETGLARTYRLELDRDAGLLGLVDALRALDKVESVTPQYLCTTPFDEPKVPPPADRLYAHRMVGVDQALDFEPGDRALIVGVVDSGVDLSHPELGGRLRPGVDTVDLPADQVSRSIVLIGDAEDPDKIPRDRVGHGTACASIIAAIGHRMPLGIGGVSPIVAGRALATARTPDRPMLTAIGALSDIDDAVKALVDLGARVLNLSFGTPESALRPDDERPHADIVEYARRRGCVLIAASGNDARYTRYYPAAHPHVIAVGSVGPNGQPSHFSTRGDHVALCAPGEHIPAATVGGYDTVTGSSFAAPFVAGACALLMARAARYGRPIDTDTIRTFLTAHARPFAANADIRGCGAGILNAPAALRSLEQSLAAGDMRSPVRPLSTETELLGAPA